MLQNLRYFVEWIGGSAALASWVQAIGAIVAIVATGMIARGGVREQRRQAFRKQRDDIADYISFLTRIREETTGRFRKGRTAQFLVGLLPLTIWIVERIDKTATAPSEYYPTAEIPRFMRILREVNAYKIGPHLSADYSSARLQNRSASALVRISAVCDEAMEDIKKDMAASPDADRLTIPKVAPIHADPFGSYVEIIAEIDRSRREFRKVYRSLT